MDSDLERKSLVETYLSFVQILHDKGLSHDVLDEKGLAALSLHDLNGLVKRVRDLARTPTS